MKRFRRTFLHIGLHKTGSSAIQEVCAENRTVLQRHGVYFPSGHWHGPLASCFASDKVSFVYNRHAGRLDAAAIERADRLFIEKFMEEVVSVDCASLLLSYEGFIDLDITELCKFSEFLSSFSSEVQVIAYCRHPLSFAPSEISQRAKMGVPTGRRDQSDLPILKFKDYFEKFVSVFGAKNFLVSDSSTDTLHRSDARFDILSKVGLSDLQQPELKLKQARTNVSLSAEATLIAEAMADLTKPVSHGNIFFIKYNQLLSSIKGSPLTLSEQERQAIMAASKDHLDYLKRTFGLVLKAPLLPADRSELNFGADSVRFIAEYFMQHDLVSQAYKWLLGRQPESEDVVLGHLAAAKNDPRAMRQNIMRSPEFQKSFAALSSASPKAVVKNELPDQISGQAPNPLGSTIPLEDITICMILLEEENILPKCLAALPKGFSFVIADMGSRDGTQNILREMLGERAQIVHYDRSLLLEEGYGAARNFCAKFATRPWIFMLDADEILLSGIERASIKIDRVVDEVGMVSIERRNLAKSEERTPMPIDVHLSNVATVEWPRRLYRNTGEAYWSGYIHEELIAKDGVSRIMQSKSSLIFNHFSLLRTPERIKARREMYFWMLLRSYEDETIRGGTNSYWYKKFVPGNLEMIREGARHFAARRAERATTRVGCRAAGPGPV